MSGKWFFNLHQGVVYLQARFEGPGGIIGDAMETVKPGGSFRGLPYALLAAADAGVVEKSAKHVELVGHLITARLGRNGIR